MTYDIDLILDLGDKNLTDFLQLLNGWGFKPKVPVGVMEFPDSKKREEGIKNRNMKAFNLVNPDWAISEIDIVITTPIDYKVAEGRINYISMKDVSIPTISIPELIKMKQASGRRQDRVDIENLKKVLDEK